MSPIYLHNVSSGLLLTFRKLLAHVNKILYKKNQYPLLSTYETRSESFFSFAPA